MGSDLIYQLLYKDNWEAVEYCLKVFDGMPYMMRMCVDFKMTGDTNEEVAQKLGISQGNVRKQLSLAKKRIIRSLNVKIIEDID